MAVESLPNFKGCEDVVAEAFGKALLAIHRREQSGEKDAWEFRAEGILDSLKGMGDLGASALPYLVECACMRLRMKLVRGVVTAIGAGYARDTAAIGIGKWEKVKYRIIGSASGSWRSFMQPHPQTKQPRRQHGTQPERCPRRLG